tara:strand:+ start:3644 stop:4066 length:423 start_codon:yes stop_codon:yes gene_type:complete
MTKGKKTVWGGKATVNDWMMKYIGLPIVWGWLMAALGIVAMGVYEPDAVMPMLEGYIALLAIVGTLATLIVTSMLELWKTEQTQEIGTMEDRIAHRHRMEEMEMAHLHRLEQIAATGEYVNKENDKINTQIGMKDKTKSE